MFAPVAPSRSHFRVILIVFLAVAAPLFAADFVVDTTLDLPDATPGDGMCSDGAGRCSLRAAIMEANALAGPDTVAMPQPGWYRLTIAGADEDAGATGDLDITEALAITGQGPDATVIDASFLAGGDRVMHVTDAASLTGLNIRGGMVAGWGGGIAVSGNLELSDCVIEDNSAAEGGGGIAFVVSLNVLSELTAVKCWIRDNIAVNGSGGGVGTEAVPHANARAIGSVTMDDCAISRNVALYDGAGMYVDSMSLAGCSVQENLSLSGSGGGLAAVWPFVTSTINIQDSSVRGNIAGADGGGIFVDIYHAVPCDIVRSDITGNYAENNGGGICLVRADGSLIDECSVDSNMANSN
ncbi:MAG TPA: hypothetical protein P5572_16235, partial [Phycisphaerae bacterium]|nr:hypothetical protein [Phycisphaerae bacterium]